MGASMFPKLPLGRFSRQMGRLNLISSGPGSVVVPKTVKEVCLLYKRDNKDGHMGAKKFFSEFLPRIQFHNPDLPIIVTRVEVMRVQDKKKVPAYLKFRNLDDQVKQVDIKNMTSEEILELFIKESQATPAEEIIIDRPPKPAQ